MRKKVEYMILLCDTHLSLFMHRAANKLKALFSPSPVSLLCAFLLCLLLAGIFTVKTPFTAPIYNITTLRNNLTPLPPPPKINTTSTALYNHPLPTPPKTNITSNALPNYSPPPKTNITRVREPVPEAEPPHIVWDDNDNSLSQLAARVDPYPTPGVHKKIAFMFLTNSPLPFAPLWELYFNQTPTHLYNIYIHADPNSSYDPPFRGVFAHRVIPSKATRRYTPTLCSGARRLLAHALLHDASNYMFALLSPSCIPLHSFNFTYNTLIQSNRSFIEILINEHGAYEKWAARGKLIMLPEVPFENFRIGSQFFVLTRQHARIVASDIKVWSKFKLPCLYHMGCCYPEEQYFPTLMSMMDPRGCVPSTLTHVDWRGGKDGHPRTYTLTDLCPELIWTLRNATPRYGDDGTNGSDVSVSRRSHPPFLFARKFAPETLTPLLEMANDVIFKD